MYSCRAYIPQNQCPTPLERFSVLAVRGRFCSNAALASNRGLLLEFPSVRNCTSYLHKHVVEIYLSKSKSLVGIDSSLSRHSHFGERGFRWRFILLYTSRCRCMRGGVFRPQPVSRTLPRSDLVAQDESQSLRNLRLHEMPPYVAAQGISLKSQAQQPRYACLTTSCSFNLILLDLDALELCISLLM